jgi:ABC-type antimicrobial peptide transport system permease subunit
MLLVSAGMALILGLVGVYGVISYGVSQRSRELGMRKALGAPERTIKTMVLRQGLVLSGVGGGLGLVIALGLGGVMENLLFGVNPVDALTFGSVMLGLTTVSLLASYLPAHRASQADPMAAFRAE